MVETDKDNEVAKNTDASIKNALKNMLAELCKSYTMSERNAGSYHSNMFLEGDKLLYDKEKMLKKPVEDCKKRSATSVKSDRVSDGFSTENEIEPSDLCIRNFQAQNRNNKPQNAKAPHLDAGSGTPCSICDFMICRRKISESDSDSKSAILNTSRLPSAELITSISNKEFSNKGSNSSTKDRVEDASLDYNSQTPTSAIPFSDSDSNIPSSHSKSSKRDLEASTMMFTDKSPKRFRSIMNRLNFSDGNFMNSETSTNSSNYCQRSTKMFASFMTNDEDGDCLNLPLKSFKGPSIVLDHNFLNIKSKFLLEVLKTSDRNLESYESDLNCSDSDQESDPDTRSPSEVLKELQNLIDNAEFRDIDQRAAIEAYSDMEHTLSNYQGTFVSPYANIESEMSTNLSYLDDEYDRLNALMCSKDGKTAAQNYLSDSSSIPSKALTFPRNNSEYFSSDIKFSDSDTESYHSELMFSDSDKESNHDKRSDVPHVPKELKNTINTTAEIQGMVQEKIINAEEFSNRGLSSDNDRRNFDNADGAKENEVSASSMSTDDEYEQIVALVCSEDPTTALENFLSGRNSIPSKALTLSSNVSEYCHSDFKSSGTDQELKPKEQSLDLKEHGNLMKTTVELQDLQKEDISVKTFSKRKLSLSNERVAFIDSDDTMRNEMSVSSRNNDNPFYHFLRLIDFMSSKYQKPESNEYFPDRKPTVRESNHDKRSDVPHVPKELKNTINTTAEIQGMVQEKIINAEEFSNRGLSSDNDRRNFDNADGAKENEVSASSMSTDDEYEQIVALVCSEDPTTALENYLSGRNSIPSKALTLSSNVSEYCHSDFKSSGTDQELKPKEQSLDLKEHGNLMKTTVELQDLQKEDISVKTFSKRKLSLSNEWVAFIDSDDTMRNEMSVSSKNNDNPFYHFLRLKDFMSSKYQKPELNEYFPDRKPTVRRFTEFSGRDSNIYQSHFPKSAIQPFIRKEPMREQLSLKAPIHKELKIKNTKFSVDDPTLVNGRVTTIGCVERRDSNLDTLVDIFNTVIKCQPIKKFEIPPYESTNDGRSLGKLEDTFAKYACNATELYGIDEHRNILECFLDTDSDSVMVFDVTDCFSQNSSIICDGLIKEYLNISAKINFLLIKKIKDISTEEYELRMRSLQSLDDELGYVSAKLTTTINDWVKQINEINQNFAQSRIGSRGLYHMGILRTCVQLVSILLNFSLEKQLKLEDYENRLIFHRKRSN